MGAYCFVGLGSGTHGNSLAHVVGPSKIRSVQYELYAVLTNKCQQGAYRGFGSELTNGWWSGWSIGDGFPKRAFLGGKAWRDGREARAYLVS